MRADGLKAGLRQLNSVWSVGRDIHKLQRMQNTFTRVVKLLRSNTDVMDILKDLHWLPVRYRIDFKMATLVYKVRSSSQPVYLSSLISDYAPIRSQLGLTLCTLLVLRQLSVRVLCRRRPQTFGTVYQLTSKNVPHC